ncbi:molecular chaperone HtpG [Intestinibacter bartlettii]|jgi:molecular chaperone HtpG|uniref:molecular chaperone HtpG n=3 Tax=Intestinibacter bartlettii TaxID=261299 RepID=UPI001D10C11C|nr:molecular chaperone HtpG [Intestinibacter bartlettii]MCC2706421.1 molecular chaperone HtpG [Intestinibacter bartlettii]MCC2762000.1 molecular chaperone HtpG [Intestinibacter bartlettii]MDU6474345.1 molecular chaperone HtpG [Intestinibacter bartlettii]
MALKQGSISIDTENIFPIIKKWLYSDKDIFIRELISNGCDAVSKHKRLVSLGETAGDDKPYKITVAVSKKNKTLSFSDNGIGMTADEIDKYINQVAFSGAEDFFNKYKDKMEESNDIIGHFGLGFYSAFMVSSNVEIDTLSFVPGAKPIRWQSADGMQFEITEDGTRTERGTTIILTLAEDSEEFLDEYHLRSIIKKYCSFLPVEIYVENTDKLEEEAKKKAEEAAKKAQEGADNETSEEEPKEEIKPVPLNDTNPLWLKSPKDCTDEEYIKFYQQVFNVFDEPLFWIHLNVDYPFNLKGILYFPKLKNEFELVEGKVKLYNNQVFVADNIKEVIPEFLLLLKGVIDCPDLPLNVSRSFLQNDRDVSKISKHIVKKVADKLKSLCKNEREKYESFWDDIQVFIKYGCLKDEGFYDKIKEYILYKDLDGKYITLKDYLEYAKDKHENKVFYVVDKEQQSQYIKLFKEYDLNAVILDCTIDNNFITFLEYKESGVRFKRIDSDLSDVLKDKDEEKDEKADEEIVNFFKEKIGDRVQKYSVESLKKEDTPAVILISEESRRMMEMQSRFAGLDYGFDLKEEKTLVINDRNPLIKKVFSLRDDETKKEAVDVICNQIVDLALLANKELGAEELDLFIKRSNELMSKVISL